MEDGEKIAEKKRKSKIRDIMEEKERKWWRRKENLKVRETMEE